MGIILSDKKMNIMNSAMKIGFIRKFSTCVIIIVAWILITNGKLDNLILLENINSGYWRYLSTPEIYYISKTPLDEGTDNILVSTLVSTEFDGISVTVNDDGTLVINGTYTGDKAKYLFPGTVYDIQAGNYILSDGGISVENEIQVRFLGINILAGGEIEYTMLAGLPKQYEFEWNPDDYEYARIDIAIYPGFKADNLVVRPMLRKVEDESSSYEYQPPVRLVSDIRGISNQNAYYKYGIIGLPKAMLSLVTLEDWKIWKTRINYGQRYDWLTIDLKDDTGIQLDQEGEGSNPYGTIDHYGRVINQYDRVVFEDKYVGIQRDSKVAVDGIENKNGIQGIQVELSNEISEITDFEMYLNAICNDNYTIFVVIRDDGVAAINSNHMIAFRELGLSTNFLDYDQYYRKSYCAIIEPGKNNVVENVSDNKIETSFTLEDGTLVELISDGYKAGKSSASIIVNGKEKCVGLRGMNFLVYDNEKHTIIDSVCFNTSDDLECVRVANKYR